MSIVDHNIPGFRARRNVNIESFLDYQIACNILNGSQNDDDDDDDDDDEDDDYGDDSGGGGGGGGGGGSDGGDEHEWKF